MHNGWFGGSYTEPNRAEQNRMKTISDGFIRVAQNKTVT